MPRTLPMVASLALIAVFALAGCDAFTPPPPPAYTDPFAGLLDKSSASAPSDRAVAVRQPLGVLFSNNVETYLEQTQKLDVVPQKYGNTKRVTDQDPKFVAARVLSIIRVRYPQLDSVDDFNQGIAKGDKSFALIDTQIRAGWFSGEKTTVDINVFFFDGNAQPLSRISGHGTATVPYPNTSAGIEPATDAAIAEIQEKFASLLR